jgi:hypothetical protein
MLSSMSASSSTTTAIVPPIFAVRVSEKLTKGNYPLWSAQVLSAIRAAQLEDLILGVEKAPKKEITVMVNEKSEQQKNLTYMTWVTKDQSVLGYILSTLTRETLMHVSRCTTLAAAWSALATLSQTRACSVNTRTALATMKRNQSSVTYYFTKMSAFADDLAASDTLLHDHEFVAYLLAGLDEEYNPVFTTIVSRADPISPGELYAQLLSFEHHMALQSISAPGRSSSSLATSRGRGYSGSRGYGSSDRGHAHRRGHDRSSHGGHSGRGSTDKPSRPQCQVRLKIGHTANNYWHRFEDYVPEPRTTAATSSSGFESSWYTDSGATDHIMGNLDKLTMHDHYDGADQVHAANGTCMTISCISKSVIPTPSRDLVLNNVLHVPSTHKNLISVHRFTLDNDTFIEYHPFFFLIKDQKTRKVLLHGRVKVIFTLSHHLHPNIASLSSVPSRYLLLDGIVILVILPMILFIVSCPPII